MPHVETDSDETRSETSDIQFHLALHVKSIEQSCEFYARLFDSTPVKQRADYAKFELTSPPLVLSLMPHVISGVGALNHLGFRLPSVEALVEMQVRLETSGIASQRAEGISCCHSYQTKFWVADPDGNQWEFYTLTGEVSEDEDEESHEVPAVNGQSADDHSEDAGNRPPAKSIWAHRLGEPAPQRIMALDESVDQVQLHGAFNAAWQSDDLARLLRESLRSLKPGGELFVHALVADHTGLAENPQLPGPASAVEIVPTIAEVNAHLLQAGFIAIEFTKISEYEVFNRQEISLREVKVSARKVLNVSSISASSDEPGRTCTVIYRGPFESLTDDRGVVFRRGEQTCVPEEIWHHIVESLAQDQFVLIADSCLTSCTC